MKARFSSRMYLAASVGFVVWASVADVQALP